jgi:hypothetical protein
MTTILIFAVALGGTMGSGPVAVASPFDDAAAVWHLSDLTDSAGGNSSLAIQGDVQVGVELEGAEREASLARGGDGRVAVFEGGYLSADQGSGGELNLAGSAMSLCLRLRDPSGEWNTPLLAKHGGHGKLTYSLFSTDLGSGVALGFELGTDWHERPLQLSIPVRLIGPTDWHDVVVRFTGPTLELFVDGALVDEEWPIGSLRHGNAEPCLISAESSDGKVKSGFRGMIDHAALWDRALTDEEIVALSGGAERVAKREREILGPEPPVCQYWRPRGHNTGAGDCIPFFHEGRFHLFYLFDRRRHQSKWGLGAHQWAHASTTDLVHWEHHPLAVPITEQWEGSICTGSAFFHDGRYYAFYAARMFDGSAARLQAATSTDGVRFEKTPHFVTLGPPYVPGPGRDPVVFRDQRTGLFHMLVTTELVSPPVAGHGGCLADLVSTDLRDWKQQAPFIVPGYTGQPECPDYFEWSGWYYLIFSNDGVARYRLSRNPLGPWQRPAVDVLDGPQARVMKTAAFTGGRRIGAAFLGDGGYGGNVLFREITQDADGSLATKFPAEIIPATGQAARLESEALTPGVAFGGNAVRLSAVEGFCVGALNTAPRDYRLTFRVVPEPDSSVFGVCVRGSGAYATGQELRFEPLRRKVGWRRPDSNSVEEHEGTSLHNVEGLDRPFDVDLIAKGDILDVCIDHRRTLVMRAPRDLNGDRLFFFAQNANVRFEAIAVHPFVS